jgi:uncharacterized membrane protein YkoI
MKTTTSWISGVVLGCLAVGCGSVQDRSVKAQASGPAHAMVDDDDEGDDESEEAVALSQVPEAIKQAALAAVPGLVLSSAEKETEDGTLLYSLEGSAGGETVEVEVRASDSKVLEIERGEDDEDGEDD